MSTAEAITYAVVGFFALLALLVFLRLIFRKGPPAWTQIRMGVYIERIPSEWLAEEERPQWGDGPYDGPPADEQPTLVIPPPPPPKIEKPPGRA